MKNTTKPTKGEWYCNGPKIQDTSGQTYFSIQTRDPEIRNGTYLMPGFYYPHSVQSPEEMKANADHIVKCVNAHAGLIAALQAVVEFEERGAREGEPRIGTGILNKIHSALKKATAQ